MSEKPPSQDLAKAEDTTENGADSAEQKQGSRIKKAAAWAIPVGVLALGYVGLAMYSGHTAPEGTTVAGVDVGNKDRAAIIDALNTGLTEKSSADVEFAATGQAVDTEEKRTSATVPVADAGVSLNVEKTADSLVGFNLDPRIIIERLSGAKDRAPVIDVNKSVLNTTAETVAENLSVPAQNAELTYGEDKAQVTEATTGTQVSAQTVAQAVTEQWLRAETVEVAPDSTEPEVSTEEAERVKHDIADPAVSDKLTLTVTGETQAGKKLQVTPAALRKSASFKPENNTLLLTFDGDKLAKAVMEDNADIGARPQDATFNIKNGKPEVVPSKDGVAVASNDVVTAVEDALKSSDRASEVQLSAQKAKFTTEDAEKIDVNQVISEFSTPFNSQAGRDTNLKVASGQVSGTVLQPGEQFSLNDTLGPRTAAAGYKQAGVISNGQMKEDFGGGVSQVSTTLFNAAFFAGFDLDEHTAHSRYISRYPEGRETTLDYTSIDLKFTNNSKTPVVLDMYVSGGKVHARIFGVKTVDVEADASKRFNYTSPTTITETGPACKPQAPVQGWSITIYRTMKDANTGAVVKKDDFTTVYRPVNRVECK